MPDDITIKVALEGQALKVGRSGWTASVGRFEASADRKPDVAADLAAQVKRAVEQRDLGSILRVGVAGDEVHVLHVRHDGRYEIVRAPLPSPGEWSEPRHHGPDLEGRVNAVDVFADRLERAPRAQTLPDVESALRLLAESVGVVAEGDWRSVAQRTAYAFARTRAEIEGAQQTNADSSKLAEMATAGESVEGRALARLLGLPGSFNGRAGPRQTQCEALAILAESEAQRFARTLTDERKNSSIGWLQLVDRMMRDDDIDDAIQARIKRDDLIEADDLEEKAAYLDWEDHGPMDKAIAACVEGESLPAMAEQEMAKYIAAKVEELVAQERETRDDSVIACRDAVMAHLSVGDKELDAMSEDDIAEALRANDILRGAVADLLADDYVEHADSEELAELLRTKWERVLVGAAHHEQSARAPSLAGVAWERSHRPEAQEPPIGEQLRPEQVRAIVDAALIIPAKVTEHRWLHDIEGVQVYLGEDSHWHVQHAGGHEVDTGWKREDAVARACEIVNDARAALPAQNPTELLLALSAAVRGLLRGQATIVDVVSAGDHCRAGIPAGHPHASSVDGLLAIVDPHVDGHPLLLALERLREELDNRALLPALPIGVRALLETA